ncbi:hypothetical protein DPMN_155016 [Dreissena polymorpha]|uniref:Uncharacterized protein n=1 Tax=Dreissena polymorpha TaxID=45954 RepID=A0A9D4JAZ4_DREPO|nr:hypothetical protein DPMN_155016 [Dreissena polymorpha]
MRAGQHLKKLCGTQKNISLDIWEITLTSNGAQTVLPGLQSSCCKFRGSSDGCGLRKSYLVVLGGGRFT